jgi:hypothetical protein
MRPGERRQQRQADQHADEAVDVERHERPERADEQYRREQDVQLVRRLELDVLLVVRGASSDEIERRGEHGADQRERHHDAQPHDAMRRRAQYRRHGEVLVKVILLRVNTDSQFKDDQNDDWGEGGGRGLESPSGQARRRRR